LSEGASPGSTKPGSEAFERASQRTDKGVARHGAESQTDFALPASVFGLR